MTEDSLRTHTTTSIQRNVLEPLCVATRRVGLDKLQNRLAQVQLWMSSDLGELEAEIGALVDTASRGDVARRAAGHLLNRPGKRIRPICVMLGACLAGIKIDSRVRDLAVACELVHAATLLHDDVIDEGKERRGAAASRMVYSNSASILGGDYLLIDSLARVARASAGHPEVLSSLLSTISQMVAAEALQLEQRERFNPSRDAYLKVIEGKTASLFRWALCAAAKLHPGSLSNAQRNNLSQAGTALGTAFQLVDDVLDLTGEGDQIGKDLFADLEQGKLTWPLIIASDSDPQLTEDVRRLARQDSADSVDAADIVRRIRATGAIEATKDFADQQRVVAREALADLESSPAKDALLAVVDAAVERVH